MPKKLEPISQTAVGSAPHMVDTHLKEALELSVRILERYDRDKRVLSEEETAMVAAVQLSAARLSNGGSPVVGAARGSPTCPSPPQLGEPASPPSNGGTANRMSHLMTKLRNATGAAGMYKDLVSTKSDVDHLTDFALGCSDLSLTAANLAELVVKQIIQIQPDRIDSCIVYFADAIDEFVVDPTTGTVFAIDDMTHVGRCALKTETFTSGTKLFLPLHSGNTSVGVVEMHIKESLDDSKMRMLEATISVASLSIRNQKLFEGLRWQHTKAEAMLEMATKLSRDNLEETILVQSIMNTAKQLTESDRCSIFLVRGETLQAYFEDGATVTMSIDTGIAGHVAKTGETVNIIDAYQDPRFNSSVDKATGYKTHTILCMPVLYEGTIVAVAQLINKTDHVNKDDGSVVKRIFSKRDEELFSTFSTFTGVSLRNCRVNADLVAEKRKSEAILDVVTLLSKTDIRDVNKIVHHVMVGARKLLSADRASLFLVDKERNELYSTVADSTGGNEIRFPCGKGIAGVVASTGIGENIRDAYQDDRFNREIDKRFGYRTESVLCEPIVLNGEVLAVAQLVNKIDDRNNVSTFSAADQESFRTFALFAGISIANSHLLEFAVRAGKEAMELNKMREHGAALTRRESVKLAAITPTEREAVLAVVLPDVDVTSREFSLFTIRENAETALDAAAAVTMRILLGTGYPQKFGCTEEVLLNFVLQCRRKYRKVPYHNFFHVVDVCQTIYTFLFHGNAKDVLTDLECYILLTTALVHDLDHMGVNNSFHLKTDSPLGILSSASGNNSVLEVHHCNLAIEILGDPDSNIFMGLSQQDLTFAYRGLIDCVLATDMARHGEMLNNYINMVAKNEFDINDEAKRRMVMMMILKAGDISNVSKPFDISRQWAMAVTEEFYQQGDMEKARGVDVLPMFDRQANNELAKGQLGFINFVAKKFFDNLSTGPLAGMQWATDMVNTNRDTWQAVLDNKSTPAA